MRVCLHPFAHHWHMYNSSAPILSSSVYYMCSIQIAWPTFKAYIFSDLCRSAHFSWISCEKCERTNQKFFSWNPWCANDVTVYCSHVISLQTLYICVGWVCWPSVSSRHCSVHLAWSKGDLTFYPGSKKMDGCAHEEIIDSNLFFVASVILF